jgi:uncharacterized Rossmann fold enzyme
VSFTIKGVFDQKEREAHMAHALSLDLPRLKREKDKSGVLTIACYGPSLAYTWTKVKRPLMTVSGAHDFLIDGGIVPDFHVDVDPREHKSKFVENSHPNVRYLMASVCNPQTWENLLGRHVEIWHLVDGEETRKWCEKNDPEGVAEGGGTTVGERALVVGAMLGYRRFEVHGMDCCFSKHARHAGEHPNKDKEEMLVRLGGEVFHTSPQLFESARSMVKFICTYDVEITFMGYGLLQAMVNEAKQIRRAA